MRLHHAGGHVHIVNEIALPGYRQVVYPGPLFPANFSELEELEHGSLCVVHDWKMERVPIIVKERAVLRVDCDKKAAEAANRELERLAEERATDVKGKIVLLRVEGELAEGRVSDLKLKELIDRFYENGAYFVMRNTARLSAQEFEEFQVTVADHEELETRIVREHAGQRPINGLDADGEVQLTKELLAILGEEPPEGEKKYEYEERVVKAAKERLAPSEDKK